MKKRNFYSRMLALLLSFAMVFTTIGWDGLAIRANAEELTDTGVESEEIINSDDGVITDDVTTQQNGVIEEEIDRGDGDYYEGYPMTEDEYNAYLEDGDLSAVELNIKTNTSLQTLLYGLKMSFPSATHFVVRVVDRLPGEESAYESIYVPETISVLRLECNTDPDTGDSYPYRFKALEFNGNDTRVEFKENSFIEAWETEAVEETPAERKLAVTFPTDEVITDELKFENGCRVNGELCANGGTLSEEGTLECFGINGFETLSMNDFGDGVGECAYIDALSDDNYTDQRLEINNLEVNGDNAVLTLSDSSADVLPLVSISGNITVDEGFQIGLRYVDYESFTAGTKLIDLPDGAEEGIGELFFLPDFSPVDGWYVDDSGYLRNTEDVEKYNYTGYVFADEVEYNAYVNSGTIAWNESQTFQANTINDLLLKMNTETEYTVNYVYVKLNCGLPGDASYYEDVELELNLKNVIFDADVERITIDGNEYQKMNIWYRKTWDSEGVNVPVAYDGTDYYEIEFSEDDWHKVPDGKGGWAIFDKSIETECVEFNICINKYPYHLKSITGDSDDETVLVSDYVCMEAPVVAPQGEETNNTQTLNFKNTDTIKFGFENAVRGSIVADNVNKVYFSHSFRCNGMTGFTNTFFEAGENVENPDDKETIVIELSDTEKIYDEMSGEPIDSIPNSKILMENVSTNTNVLFRVCEDTEEAMVGVSGEFTNADANHDNGIGVEYLSITDDLGENPEFDFSNRQVFIFEDDVTQEFANHFYCHPLSEDWIVNANGCLEKIVISRYEGYIFTGNGEDITAEDEYNGYVNNTYDEEEWNSFWSAEKIQGETLQEVLDEIGELGNNPLVAVYPIRNTDDSKEESYENITVPSNITAIAMGGVCEEQTRNVEILGDNLPLYVLHGKDGDGNDVEIKFVCKSGDPDLYYEYNDEEGSYEETAMSYEEIADNYSVYIGGGELTGEELYAAFDKVFGRASDPIAVRLKSITLESGFTEMYFVGRQGCYVDAWEDASAGKVLEFKVNENSENIITVDSVEISGKVIAAEDNYTTLIIKGDGLKAQGLNNFNVSFEQTQEVRPEIRIVDGGLCDVNNVSFETDQSEGEIIVEPPVGAEDYSYEDLSENDGFIVIRGDVIKRNNSQLMNNLYFRYDNLNWGEDKDKPEPGTKLIFLVNTETFQQAAAHVFYDNYGGNLAIDMDGCYYRDPADYVYRGALLTAAQYDKYVAGDYGDNSTTAKGVENKAFWDSLEWFYADEVDGLLEELQDNNNSTRQYALIIKQSWPSQDNFEDIVISDQWAKIALVSDAFTEQRYIDGTGYDVYVMNCDNGGEWFEERYVKKDDGFYKILQDEYWNDDSDHGEAVLDTVAKTLKELEEEAELYNGIFQKGIGTYDLSVKSFSVAEDTTVFCSANLRGSMDEMDEGKVTVYQTHTNDELTGTEKPSTFEFDDVHMEGVFAFDDEGQNLAKVNVKVYDFLYAKQILGIHQLSCVDRNGDNDVRVEAEQNFEVNSVVTDNTTNIKIYDQQAMPIISNARNTEVKGMIRLNIGDYAPEEGTQVVEFTDEQTGTTDYIDGHYLFYYDSYFCQEWAIDSNGMTCGIAYYAVAYDSASDLVNDDGEEYVRRDYFGSDLQKLLNNVANAGEKYVRVEKRQMDSAMIEELTIPAIIEEIIFNSNRPEKVYSNADFKDGKEFTVCDFYPENGGKAIEFIMEETGKYYKFDESDGTLDTNALTAEELFGRSDFHEMNTVYEANPLTVHKMVMKNPKTNIGIQSAILTTEEETPTLADKTFTVEWPNDTATGSLYIDYCDPIDACIASAVAGSTTKKAGNFVVNNGNRVAIDGIYGFNKVTISGALVLKHKYMGNSTSDLGKTTEIGQDARVVIAQNDVTSDYYPISVGTIAYRMDCDKEGINYQDGLDDWKCGVVYYLKRDAVSMENRYEVINSEWVREKTFLLLDGSYYQVSDDGNVSKTASSYTEDMFETRTNKLKIYYSMVDNKGYEKENMNDCIDAGVKVLTLAGAADVNKIRFFEPWMQGRYIDANGRTAQYQYSAYEFASNEEFTNFDKGNYSEQPGCSEDEKYDAWKFGCNCDLNTCYGDDLNTLLTNANSYTGRVFARSLKDMTAPEKITVPATIEFLLLVNGGKEIQGGEFIPFDAKYDSLTLQSDETTVVLRETAIGKADTTNGTFTITFNSKDATGTVNLIQAFSDNIYAEDSGVKLNVTAKDATAAEKADPSFTTGTVYFIDYNVLNQVKGIKNYGFAESYLLFTKGYNAVDFSYIQLLSEGITTKNEIVYTGYDPDAVPTFSNIDTGYFSIDDWAPIELKYVEFKEEDQKEEWPDNIGLGSYLYKINKKSLGGVDGALLIPNLPEGNFINSKGQMTNMGFARNDSDEVIDNTLAVEFAYADAGNVTKTDTIALDFAENYSPNKNTFALGTEENDITEQSKVADCASLEKTDAKYVATFAIAKSVSQKTLYLWYVTEDAQMCLGEVTIDKTIINMVTPIAPDEVTVNNKTTYDYICSSLPQVIYVKSQNPMVITLEVKWDLVTPKETYDPEKLDRQEILFTGTIKETADASVPTDKRKVECKVVIEGKPYEVEDIVVNPAPGVYRIDPEEGLDVSLQFSETATAEYALYTFGEDDWSALSTEPKGKNIKESTTLSFYIPAKIAEDNVTVLRPASEIVNYQYTIAYNTYKMLVQAIPAQTYTGQPIKPEVVVYDGTKLLVLNKDYTVKYMNNINRAIKGDVEEKDLPTAIIEGKGNYSSKITVHFEINPLQIKDEDLIVKRVTSLTVNAIGEADLAKAIESVSYGSKKFVMGKDYLLSFCDSDGRILSEPERSYCVINQSDSSKNIYSIIISGSGNYAFGGSYSVELTERQSLSKAKIVLNTKNLAYSDITGDAESLIKSVKYGTKVIKGYYSSEVIYSLNEEGMPDEGPATLTITALDDSELTGTLAGTENPYAGSKTISFVVTRAQISKATFALTATGKALCFTGSEVELGANDYTLTFKKPDKTVYTLQEGTDYEVSYTNNLEVGTATVEFTALSKGVFSGSLKKTFKIGKAKIATTDKKVANEFTVSVADVNGLSYTEVTNGDTGSMLTTIMDKGGVTPIVEMSYGDIDLVEDIDYKVTYRNNKAVSKMNNKGEIVPGIITIKGIGSFEGTLTGKVGSLDGLTFQVTPKKISADEISVTVENAVYKAGEKVKYQPKVTVYDWDVKLAENKDYKITYEDNTNADWPIDEDTKCPMEIKLGTVVIEGIGSYTSEYEESFMIVPKSFDKLYFEVKPQDYNGSVVTLNPETDITVKFDKKSANALDTSYFSIVGSSYEKNNKVGMASVVLEGTDIYAGSKKVTFKINKKDLQKAKNADELVTSLQSTCVMDKAGVTPLFGMSYLGNELVKGVDYTVSYKYNTAISEGATTAKKPVVTIKGKGNYSGSVSYNFEIVKKNIAGVDAETFNADITCVTPVIMYTKAGKTVTVKPKVMQDGKELKLGTDYKLEDATYTLQALTPVTGNDEQHQIMAKQEFTFKIVGINNYEGEVTQTAVVIPKAFKSLKVEPITKEYDAGNPITLEEEEIRLYYMDGAKKIYLPTTEYEIVENSYVNNVNAGKKAKVTIVTTPDSNFNGRRTIEFTITSSEIK